MTLMMLVLLALQDDKVREEYEQRRLSAPATAQGQLQLAKWCQAHQLLEEATKAYDRVLEFDPENATARRALGYKRSGGQWVRAKGEADPRIDQKKVDEAIRRGCEFLLSKADRSLPYPHLLARTRLDELILLTLIHGNWDRRDPKFLKVLDIVLKGPFETTYNVSLRAMCLAELDPGKFQQQIAQCAQFLVDNQCENGQWTYGKPSTNIPSVGSFSTRMKGPIYIPTGAKKPDVPGQIEIKKGKAVGDKLGDNSNSQYAALGLRACLSAFVVVPRETIQKAHEWWEKCQQKDGGWSYDMRPSWGSMTAGGLGALVIYKYYLNRVWNEDQDYRRAPSIVKGIEWMGAQLSYDINPMQQDKDKTLWLYYWIYAVERAGRLAETEKFGGHEWYIEGVQKLLPAQRSDGSWTTDPKKSQEEILSETCFAVLFLRRATPSISETIESVDAKQKKD